MAEREGGGGRGKKWRILGDRWDRIDRYLGEKAWKLSGSASGQGPTTRETRANQDQDCGIVRSRYARVLANLYSVPPRYQGSRWWKLTRRDAPLIGNRRMNRMTPNRSEEERRGLNFMIGIMYAVLSNIMACREVWFTLLLGNCQGSRLGEVDPRMWNWKLKTLCIGLFRGNDATLSHFWMKILYISWWKMVLWKGKIASLFKFQ